MKRKAILIVPIAAAVWLCGSLAATSTFKALFGYSVVELRSGTNVSNLALDSATNTVDCGAHIQGNDCTFEAGTVNAATALEQGGVGVFSADVNTSAQVVATHLGSPLPLAQGGTGAASLAAAGIATTAQLTGSGSVTTTAATSDSMAIAWPDGGSRTPGHCALSATNASAATNVATSYISAKAANAVTLTHTATSGMTYDVVCTVN